MNVLESYFEWLCDRIGYNEDYDSLLRYLLDVDFTWVHPMDENRAADGLYQRGEFMDEEGVRGDVFENKECSVLEMLVALSYLLEYSVMGDPDLGIFWRMIHNLGLDETGNVDLWNDILQGWMNRETIEYDGSGGLFPLKNPREDQADVEIWGQAMDWLNELCEM